MKIRKIKGLTFDDVLLVPSRSSITSRNDVVTSTRLTRTINLNIPIISANMDTVTEEAMAKAMAENGGIGIIHRFMSIEHQTKQVRNVKRCQGFIVENPYEINQDASIDDAKRLMKKEKVGGLVVKDNQNKLVGIITSRDLLLAPGEFNEVKDVMTESRNLVVASPDITPEAARILLYKHRLEKLPVLDEDGNLKGLITAQDVVKPEMYPNATLDEKGRLCVGAAIGVTSGEMERARILIEAGVDVLVLDIAHGHADHCINMVKRLKSTFENIQVIAGNVATESGAFDLAEAGADAIKVGIGPGSICTTRIVTGYGVPQLTAIMDSVKGVQESKKNIPIIADGGVRFSGDMVKALAAGAETVMVGSLFAGTEEAPGSAVIRDGQKFKVVRGMASLGAAMGRKLTERGEDESAEDQEDWDKVIPEGVEAVVPYRGKVEEVLFQLVGGLRSGLSYGGGKTIREMQEKAEFIEITPAGYRESRPHDVDRV
ncbi:MAG: IMP dehydrogenase [Chloroflexi bacterium GWB2_49_20]|nr:MAG: IMP dehydrogenase [Chloroflexi bacterium GWB2_49_20]OGN78926.1 MAG: IMP dehydrogenase [Chloroflexi bacterium GWC2_49_37]OGN86313.1 MAG: IMP dehydrogenase [Chloroflexi bacterium GWD2_49_16]HBG74541.1 IMP dehydrogenase [Anaerolineae bacterium]